MRNTTYYSTSLRSHRMMSYVQMSEISIIHQWFYYDAIIQVIIDIQYFLMPKTGVFLSSPWHTYLLTTSQIRVFSVDLTQSFLIYSLHSPTHPNFICPSLPYVNRVIVNLTLTLIDIETSSLCVNRVVVTTKPNSNKKAQKNWKMLFSPFLAIGTHA